MSKRIKIIFSALFLLVTGVHAKNYLAIPEVQVFMSELILEDHFDANELLALFGEVKYQQTALSFYNESIKPLPQKCTPTKNGTVCRLDGAWDRYSHNLLSLRSVQKGKAYMQKHRKTLDRAYKKYGVPPEYVTAIIGVESFYGANTGQYPVFDTLTTLAFEPNRRNDFFKAELKEFLRLTKREKINPREVRGSYAGAIGLGQFMPSNYQSIAVDFDHDGTINLNDPTDAIGSIAHYFKQSGWQKGQEVAVPATFLGTRYIEKKTGTQQAYKRTDLKKTRPKIPMRYRGDIYLIKLERGNYDELWYGTKNYYAITRYNHSDYYAMAVHQLAQKIMGKNPDHGGNSFMIHGDELDSFLDAPMKGRKFIIDL